MPQSTLVRPEASEYPAAVDNYLKLVPEGELLAILAAQGEEITRLLKKVDDQASLDKPPPYAWSIRQVVGHLIDSERVFGYRTLRLARNDATPLPGFDENNYMLFANFDAIPLADLVEELTLLRRSHLKMFRACESAAWLRSGVVNNHHITARAVAYLMAGHTQHHLNILRTRVGA